MDACVWNQGASKPMALTAASKVSPARTWRNGAPVRCNESESTEVGHGRARHQQTELRQVEHCRAFTFDSSNGMSREISPALEIVCVEDEELVHLA